MSDSSTRSSHTDQQRSSQVERPTPYNPLQRVDRDQLRPMTMSFFKRKSEHHASHRDENAQQQQAQQTQVRPPQKMPNSGSMSDLASQGYVVPFLLTETQTDFLHFDSLPQNGKMASSGQPLRNMPGGPNGILQSSQRSTMMDGGAAMRDGQQMAIRPRSSSAGFAKPGAAPPTVSIVI